MNWKILLKEIRMDKDANCCEEARMKIIDWFEEHIEKLQSGDSLRDSLIATSTALSEESCEDLYDSITRFMEMYDLESSELFDADSLADIVNEWDKSREEPRAEENPALQPAAFGIFQEDPTAWMDKYIRNR